MNISKDIYRLVCENLDQILLFREERVFKKDGSYVTKGDFFCQKLITDYLNSLDSQFLVVSEEMDQTTFVYDEKKNYIVIDPIDGTENFTSGLKEWGISVSVFKMGKHYESMIMMPELDLHLATGDKFTRRHSRIHGLSSSLQPQHISNLKGGNEYRITGCCVYNMYNVITGSFSKFENPIGAYSWDILAGLNLALENSLQVSLNGEIYDGGFLLPNQKYPFKVCNNHD